MSGNEHTEVGLFSIASRVILKAYSNVIGAFIAAPRWKEMQSAPVAFPTGRFT